MKRVPVPPHPALTWRTWPVLFWRTCRACDKAFRREWGWRCLVGFFAGVGREVYVCRACAPTAQQAHRIANAPRFARPPAPPPSPLAPRHGAQGNAHAH